MRDDELDELLTAARPHHNLNTPEIKRELDTLSAIHQGRRTLSRRGFRSRATAFAAAVVVLCTAGGVAAGAAIAASQSAGTPVPAKSPSDSSVAMKATTADGPCTIIWNLGPSEDTSSSNEAFHALSKYLASPQASSTVVNPAFRKSLASGNGQPGSTFNHTPAEIDALALAWTITDEAPDQVGYVPSNVNVVYSVYCGADSVG